MPGDVLVRTHNHVGLVSGPVLARGIVPSVEGNEIAAGCRPINECSTCDDKAMLERWARMDPPLRIR